MTRPLSLGISLGSGIDGWVSFYGYTDEQILALIDAHKDLLATTLGISTSLPASFHLYPASFSIWSTMGTNVMSTPAPRGAGFPSSVLLNGLRARGITPMVFLTMYDNIITGPYHIWSNWTAGMFDSYLDEWAQAAKAYRDNNVGALNLMGLPQSNDIILRLGWEMNGDWFPWSIGGGWDDGVFHVTNNTPARLIAGWRHIHDRIRVTNGATNVKLFFCGNQGGGYTVCYPGDPWVEYVGFDAYTSFGGGVADYSPDMVHTLSYDLAICSGLSLRPIIVGEMGVGGGKDSLAYPGTNKERGGWFTGSGGMAALRAKYPRLRGITYFNINMENPAPWPSFPDWTVERNSQTLAAWATAVHTYRSRYEEATPMTVMHTAMGVLRNADDGEGWKVYQGVSSNFPNGSHFATGLGACTVDSDGVLHVALVPEGVMTGGFQCIPDETMTKNAVSAGISGSKDEARIHFYQMRYGRLYAIGANNKAVKGASTNLWFRADVIDSF